MDDAIKQYNTEAAPILRLIYVCMYEMYESLFVKLMFYIKVNHFSCSTTQSDKLTERTKERNVWLLVLFILFVLLVFTVCLSVCLFVFLTVSCFYCHRNKMLFSYSLTFLTLGMLRFMPYKQSQCICLLLWLLSTVAQCFVCKTKAFYYFYFIGILGILCIILISSLFVKKFNILPFFCFVALTVVMKCLWLFVPDCILDLFGSRLWS